MIQFESTRVDEVSSILHEEGAGTIKKQGETIIDFIHQKGDNLNKR